jgi:hypothetical protein
MPCATLTRMRQVEAIEGERQADSRLLALGLVGMLAVTAAVSACTSNTSATPKPTRNTVVTGPPAEGCIAIETDKLSISPDGTTYAIRLIGRWGTGTFPTGERLTITRQSPYPHGPSHIEQTPNVPPLPDGALPEPLLYEFPASETVTHYLVQGVISMRHGSRESSPVTTYCKTEVDVPATYDQQANDGAVTVALNLSP